MEEDSAEDEVISPIALDEHDKAAVMALIIRAVRMDESLKNDRALVAEANARISANTLTRSKIVTALGVFGFDPSAEDLWTQVLHSVGYDDYCRAIDIGKGQEVPKLLEQMGGDSAQSEEPELPDNTGNEGSHVPRIKDAILHYLNMLDGTGATARQVRDHLSDAYGLKVHEKTPGMTLYRLMKEGLVRRQGRTWYATDGRNQHQVVSASRADEMKTGADLA